MKIKIIDNSETKRLVSENYNYHFDKKTGMFHRWGKTQDEDPQVGIPEIADIEITTICNGPENVLCPECYKKNSHVGTNMSIETYEKILDKLPLSITQVAFGADANLSSNPDIWKIMEATRKRGVVPNITVADVDDYTADMLTTYCGAVAVSRYANKNLCYDSIKRLTDRGMKQVNIHIILSATSFDMVLETISDMRNDPRLAKMNAIVFLSLKQKGRGYNKETMSMEQFSEIVQIALDSGISFGFDSCGSHKFIRSIQGHDNFKNMVQSVEPCESSLFSTYIDVDGMFHPCSFSPKTKIWGYDGLDVVNCTDFLKDIWYHERTVAFRKSLLEGGRNCPLYNI